MISLKAPITPQDIAKLSQFKSLTGLSTASGTENVSAQHVEAYGKLAKLTVLSLSNSPLEDASLVGLVGLKNLETLNLGNTSVTGVGLRHLAGLPKLTTLSVGSGRFEAKNLALVATLKHVTTLNIRGGSFKKDGDEVVRQLAGLKDQITELRIEDAGATDEQIAAIKNAMSKTKVIVNK